MTLSGLILIFSFLFPVNFTSANEQSLTISDIEKGLLIGEDAFTDLRFEYVEQWRMLTFTKGWFIKCNTQS